MALHALIVHNQIRRAGGGGASIWAACAASMVFIGTNPVSDVKLYAIGWIILTFECSQALWQLLCTALKVKYYSTMMCVHVW